MDSDGGPPERSSAEVVDHFYALWNDGALDAAAGLFTEDASSGIPPGEKVVAPTRWSATPRGGSLDLDMEVVPVFELRDGRIAHISWYESVAQAIEALERLEPATGS